MSLQLTDQYCLYTTRSFRNCTHSLFRRYSFCSYQQALSSAQIGLRKLEELEVPIKRPEDYFAEMLKTDDHMRKVGTKPPVYKCAFYSMRGIDAACHIVHVSFSLPRIQC